MGCRITTGEIGVTINPSEAVTCLLYIRIGGVLVNGQSQSDNGITSGSIGQGVGGRMIALRIGVAIQPSETVAFLMRIGAIGRHQHGDGQCGYGIATSEHGGNRVCQKGVRSDRYGKTKAVIDGALAETFCMMNSDDRINIDILCLSGALTMVRNGPCSGDRVLSGDVLCVSIRV